jgi:hypothetical protein
MSDNAGGLPLGPLDHLWTEFEEGRIDRRRFIKSAGALGLSIPAAIALSDPAAAQSCTDAEARLEVMIASDYQISDAAVSSIEKDFASIASATTNVSQALMRPKEYKVKVKRKCICGSPFSAPDWSTFNESSEGRL